MGKMITFPRPDGQDAEGYLAEAENPKGSVVVIQEWWGLNDQIKGVADRFAAAGFTTLAPDYYAGRVTQDPDEANHMMTGLDWGGAVEQETRGAARYLRYQGGKVAVMGFCMGGALTIIAGVKVPECDAAVCYYGIPPKEVADPADMKVPFLGHFATRDDWCTPEAVAQLRQDLSGVSTPVEIHSYEGEHGFFNETRSEVHVPNAAVLSWERTIDFLGRVLK
jgi:carboxymethylenebutenolidase